MQTLPNGVEVFTNGDDYNLADDVAHAFATAAVTITVTSEQQRDALPDKFVGMTIRRADLAGYQQWWDGAIWRPGTAIFAEYGNQALVNAPVPAGGQLGPFYQAFPPGKFTVPPIVTFGSSNARLSPGWNNISTAGFDLYVRNDSPGDAQPGAFISFSAKQVTPTSAAG
jgi:hypothetical protein